MPNKAQTLVDNHYISSSSEQSFKLDKASITICKFEENKCSNVNAPIFLQHFICPFHVKPKILLFLTFPTGRSDALNARHWVSQSQWAGSEGLLITVSQVDVVGVGVIFCPIIDHACPIHV